MKKFQVLLLFLLSIGLFSCSTLKGKKPSQVVESKNVAPQPFQIKEGVLGKLKLNDHRSSENSELKNKSSHGQIWGSSTVDKDRVSLGDVYFLYGAEHLKLKNYFFDIPVVYNDAVKKWLHYFLNNGKEFFVRYSERAGRYAPILGKILEDHNLPRDLIFLAMAESGFYNQAKSSAKATGTWQFMPFTARKYGLKINWYVDERRDPIKATIAACRYLKTLYDYFGSWELATAGYNAGEGKVHRAIKKYKTENFWDLRKGRYLKLETKNYLPKIMSLAIIGKNLESFGFKDIDFHEPLDFDEFDVPGNTDLYDLADSIGVPYEEIHRLNPELLRWITPPDEPVYKLRVPVGVKSVWQECCSSKNFLASKFQTYQIKKSESLRSLAQRLRILPDILASLNNIHHSQILSKNMTILLPFREGQETRDPMYADLYEVPSRKNKQSKSRKSRQSRRNFEPEYRANSSNGLYVVKRGDTLWKISRRTGVSVNNIVKSNIKLVNLKRIREGDRLILR